MRGFTLFTLLFAWLSVTEVHSVWYGKPAGKINQRKNKVQEVLGREKYSYMVHLQIIHPTSITEDEIKGQFTYCGGVIIRRNVVLTAAHCLAEPMRNAIVYIHAGILDTEIEKDGGFETKMLDYLIHENYKFQEYAADNREKFQHNDIALIWTQMGFLFDRYTERANLIPEGKKIEKHVGYIYGWGQNERGETPSMMQKAKMRVLSQKKCDNYYGNHVLNDNVFCIMSDDQKITSGYGDSGGPFVVDGYIAGLISFSEPMDASLAKRKNPSKEIRKPVVLTHIGKYLHWIDENIRKGPPKHRTPPTKSKKLTGPVAGKINKLKGLKQNLH